MTSQIISEELKNLPATQYDIAVIRQDVEELRSDIRELINEIKNTNINRDTRCEWHNDTSKNMQVEIDSINTKITALQKYVNIGLGIVGALQFAIIVFIGIAKIGH